jgi:hypothetical protein
MLINLPSEISFHCFPFNEILSDKQANKSSQKWEEVKLDGAWMKLKHPESGLFLHVSEDGEKLTIEEDSKGWDGKLLPEAKDSIDNSLEIVKNKLRTSKNCKFLGL